MSTPRASHPAAAGSPGKGGTSQRQPFGMITGPPAQAASPDKDPAWLRALRLGPLESAIMTVMWHADGWLTVREIQDRIDYPTRAYTSVASVAAILERKGHLRKRCSPAANHPGPRRWQYQAAVPLAEHLGGVIGGLLHHSPDPAATLWHAIFGHRKPGRQT